MEAIYSNLGLISEDEGDLLEALDWYKKSLNKLKKIAEINETEQSLLDLSVGYYRLGKVIIRANLVSEAKEYFQIALELREKATKET